MTTVNTCAEADEIAKGHIKIIPDLIINGGGDGSEGSLNGLMGLQLLSMLQDRNVKTTVTEKTPKEAPKA